MTQTNSERIARFRGMVERFPTSEVPRFSLATAYLDDGKRELAAQTLDEVIQLKPDFLMAWTLRARVLVQLERFADARPVALEAIRLAKAQGHSEPRIEAEALLEEIEREVGPG